MKVSNTRRAYQRFLQVNDVFPMCSRQEKPDALKVAISSNVHELAALSDEELSQFSPSLQRYVLMRKKKQPKNGD
jgi:hypothetical protein